MVTIPCYVAVFYVLIHVSAEPRVLHSFPTRRSSDLSCGVRATPSGCCVASAPQRLVAPTPPWIPSFERRTPVAAPHRCRRRSEEHTSELQSLRHLVCRLLLEKKKRIYKQHMHRRPNH